MQVIPNVNPDRGETPEPSHSEFVSRNIQAYLEAHVYQGRNGRKMDNG